MGSTHGYVPEVRLIGSTSRFYGTAARSRCVSTSAGGYVSFDGGCSTGSVVAGKSCAYCGRYAIEAVGNCDGCGAPLNRREVKPL